MEFTHITTPPPGNVKLFITNGKSVGIAIYNAAERVFKSKNGETVHGVLGWAEMPDQIDIILPDAHVESTKAAFWAFHKKYPSKKKRAAQTEWAHLLKVTRLKANSQKLSILCNRLADGYETNLKPEHDRLFEEGKSAFIKHLQGWITAKGWEYWQQDSKHSEQEDPTFAALSKIGIANLTEYREYQARSGAWEAIFARRSAISIDGAVKAVLQGQGRGSTLFARVSDILDI